MVIRALIFDVDGTLAETEEIHRQAFNQSFAEAGLDWNWTQPLYRRLLRVTGGKERIAAYIGEQGGGTAAIDIPALHRRKTEIYNARIRDRAVALRPGVEALIKLARGNALRLAVATTTSRPNVDSLIAATLGEGALSWFETIRCGEDVRRKKPDAEVYRLVLADLGLAGPDCIAFEDSANGLLAAQGAGIPTVITPSLYTDHEDFTGARLVLSDLADNAALGIFAGIKLRRPDGNLA